MSETMPVGVQREGRVVMMPVGTTVTIESGEVLRIDHPGLLAELVLNTDGTYLLTAAMLSDDQNDRFFW